MAQNPASIDWDALDREFDSGDSRSGQGSSSCDSDEQSESDDDIQQDINQEVSSAREINAQNNSQYSALNNDQSNANGSSQNNDHNDNAQTTSQMIAEQLQQAQRDFPNRSTDIDHLRQVRTSSSSSDYDGLSESEWSVREDTHVDESEYPSMCNQKSNCPTNTEEFVKVDISQDCKNLGLKKVDKDRPSAVKGTQFNKTAGAKGSKSTVYFGKHSTTRQAGSDGNVSDTMPHGENIASQQLSSDSGQADVEQTSKQRDENTGQLDSEYMDQESNKQQRNIDKTRAPSELFPQRVLGTHSVTIKSERSKEGAQHNTHTNVQQPSELPNPPEDEPNTNPPPTSNALNEQQTSQKAAKAIQQLANQMVDNINPNTFVQYAQYSQKQATQPDQSRNVDQSQADSDAQVRSLRQAPPQKVVEMVAAIRQEDSHPESDEDSLEPKTRVQNIESEQQLFQDPSAQKDNCPETRIQGCLQESLPFDTKLESLQQVIKLLHKKVVQLSNELPNKPSITIVEVDEVLSGDIDSSCIGAYIQDIGTSIVNLGKVCQGKELDPPGDPQGFGGNESPQLLLDTQGKVLQQKLKSRPKRYIRDGDNNVCGNHLGSLQRQRRNSFVSNVKGVEKVRQLSYYVRTQLSYYSQPVGKQLPTHNTLKVKRTRSPKKGQQKQNKLATRPPMLYSGNKNKLRRVLQAFFGNEPEICTDVILGQPPVGSLVPSKQPEGQVLGHPKAQTGGQCISGSQQRTSSHELKEAAGQCSKHILLQTPCNMTTVTPNTQLTKRQASSGSSSQDGDANHLGSSPESLRASESQSKRQKLQGIDWQQKKEILNQDSWLRQHHLRGRLVKSEGQPQRFEQYLSDDIAQPSTPEGTLKEKQIVLQQGLSNSSSQVCNINCIKDTTVEPHHSQDNCQNENHSHSKVGLNEKVNLPNETLPSQSITTKDVQNQEQQQLKVSSGVKDIDIATVASKSDSEDSRLALARAFMHEMSSRLMGREAKPTSVHPAPEAGQSESYVGSDDEESVELGPQQGKNRKGGPAVWISSFQEELGAQEDVLLQLSQKGEADALQQQYRGDQLQLLNTILGNQLSEGEDKAQHQEKAQGEDQCLQGTMAEDKVVEAQENSQDGHLESAENKLAPQADGWTGTKGMTPQTQLREVLKRAEQLQPEKFVFYKQSSSVRPDSILTIEELTKAGTATLTNKTNQLLLDWLACNTNEKQGSRVKYVQDTQPPWWPNEIPWSAKWRKVKANVLLVYALLYRIYTMT